MKRIKYILYSVLIILFFLFIIEGLFRIFGAGHPTRMLIREKTSYGTYYTLNKHFADKYFSQFNNRIPTPASHLFRTDKPDTVYRIVVLGESTSLGFPYSKLEAFPFQIQQMMNNAGCDKSFEVINFSMTAINSHIGADMAKEISKCQPDLVLVYFGHNEFIGIGGSGGYHKLLFRLNYGLSHLRFYQALKSVISKKNLDSNESLFEIMTKDKGVKYKSKVYNRTLVDFENNYNKIVSVFTDKNVPVICLGVVKNKKDFPPGPPRKISIPFQKIIDDSLHFRENFRKLNDTLTSAYTMFRFGKVLFENGLTKEADIMFTKAVDYDKTRFRAPGDINRIISEISEKKHCNYIDCQLFFDTISLSRITGNELILEHVHPTLSGHYFIAQRVSQFILDSILKCNDYRDEFYNIIIRSSLPDKFKSANQMLSFYQSKYIREINFFNPLGIDQIYSYDITDNGIKYAIRDSSIMNHFEILLDVRRRTASLPAWHINYGNWLLKNNLPRDAMLEYHQAYLLNPLNPAASNNYALLLFQFGEKEKAIQIITEILEIGHYKNSKLAMNLAFIYMHMNRRTDAQKVLAKYFGKNKDIQPEGIRPSMYSY